MDRLAGPEEMRAWLHRLLLRILVPTFRRRVCKADALGWVGVYGNGLGWVGVYRVWEDSSRFECLLLMGTLPLALPTQLFQALVRGRQRALDITKNSHRVWARSGSVQKT